MPRKNALHRTHRPGVYPFLCTFREEIVDVLSFLEVGYNLPAHLEHEVLPPAKK